MERKKDQGPCQPALVLNVKALVFVEETCYTHAAPSFPMVSHSWEDTAVALCPQAGGLAVASEGLILQPLLSICSQWGHSHPQASPPPRSQGEAPKGMGPVNKMSPEDAGH